MKREKSESVGVGVKWNDDDDEIGLGDCVEETGDREFG